MNGRMEAVRRSLWRQGARETRGGSFEWVRFLLGASAAH